MRFAAWLLTCGLLLQGVCAHPGVRPGIRDVTPELTSSSGDHPAATKISQHLPANSSKRRPGKTCRPRPGHSVSGHPKSGDSWQSGSNNSTLPTSGDSSQSGSNNSTLPTSGDSSQSDSHNSTLPTSGDSSQSGSNNSTLPTSGGSSQSDSDNADQHEQQSQENASSSDGYLVATASVSMSDPTGSPASAAAAVVTNPSNPQQTATFVKEEASDDLLAALPLIPAAGLPLIVSVGGSAVPAVVDSAGMIVRPLGSAPSWIKPDIFPAADSIGETLNPGKTVPVGSGSGGGAGTGSGGGSESGSGDGAGSGSGGGNESESDTESSSGSNTESGSGAEPTGSSSSTSPEESSTTEPESSSTEPPGETLATRTITITTDINTFRAIPNFPIITGSGRPADTPGASNTQNDSQPSKTDNNSQPTNTDNNSQPSNNENNSQPPNNENNSQPSNTENNSQPSNTENASQTSNLQPMYTPDPSLTTVDSHGNGTKIHVDSGCISVNGQTICGHWDLATVRTDAETSKVKIYGKFDSEDAAWYNKKGGCELTASWPSEYGDVRYQDDNCLHDADGNIIDNQCCTEPAKDDVPNPYGPICKREYSFSVDQVTIYSSGWMTDDGSNLWKQMSRCGPVTKWEVNPVRNQEGQKWVYFHLPIQIGGSCVQQGIWEAGGPWANC